MSVRVITFVRTHEIVGLDFESLPQVYTTLQMSLDAEEVVRLYNVFHAVNCSRQAID